MKPTTKVKKEKAKKYIIVWGYPKECQVCDSLSDVHEFLKEKYAEDTDCFENDEYNVYEVTGEMTVLVDINIKLT